MGRRLESPEFLVPRPIVRPMNRIREKVETVKVDKTTAAFPQVEPIRDEFYLDLLRQLPSIVSSMGPCIVHHLRLSGHDGGTGMRPGDNQAVPLLDAEHKALHSAKMGDKRYWAFTGVDARLCASWLFELYLSGWSFERAVEIIQKCQPREGV
jgi:hypothetical protein